MKSKWIELVVEITILIIGLLGNVFVLIIVQKKQSRKTVHGTFVASLAIADLVLLCLDSPKSILGKFDVTSSTFNCTLSLSSVTTSYNAGLFTITSMAIHRCHVVTRPWKKKLGQKRGVIWVSLIWLTAFIFVIPLIIVNKPVENGCEEDWPSIGYRQTYTALLTTVQYILPLLITVTCYIRIWLFLRRRPVMPRKNKTGKSVATEVESHKESTVILRSVAVIVLLFLTCLLPNQIAWVLYDFRHVSYDELWSASDILTRLHSCLNPVVYGVMNKQYRRTYIELLSSMFCCCLSSNQSSSNLKLMQRQLSLRSHVTSKTTCNEFQVRPVTESNRKKSVGNSTVVENPFKLSIIK